MADYGAGIRDPLFFFGIVENTNDPRLEGRVKVRAFGIHGTNEDVSTEDLPWAMCVKGDYDANGSVGLGIPPGGSWVFGMFIDGRQAQQPLVLGLLPLQNTQISDPSTDKVGFIPPQDAELLNRGSAPEDFGQPAQHRLARGEYLDETNIVDQEVSRVMNVQVGGDSDGEKSWSEPGSAYSAKYPFNRVFSSGAHTIELDDTPNAERIMIYHKEGSYIQIDSNGTTTNKSVSDQFDVIDKNSHVVIGGGGSGFSTITINGNSYVKVNGNKVEEITGDLQTLVHGNYLLSVGSQMNLVGEMVQMRGGDVRVEANAGTFAMKAAKEMQIESGEGTYFKSDKVWIQATDTLNIKGNSIFTEAVGEYNILADELFITGASDANLYGTAKLQVGSGGKISMYSPTVAIDDNISMANGDADDASAASPAEGSEGAVSVEAPEPVTKNTSIMPTTERGSQGSSGVNATDDATGDGTSSGNTGSGVTATSEPTFTQSSITPLLDLINKAESGGYGYDSIYTPIRNAGRLPAKPITQMTMQEILDYQESIDASFGSEAIGRYQIIEDTLRNFNNDKPEGPNNVRGTPLYEKAGLSASDLFNPENQDKMAIQLAREAGLDAFMDGELTSESIARIGNGLAGVWAGFPVHTNMTVYIRQGGERIPVSLTAGDSRYKGLAGNNATVSVAQVVEMLREIHGKNQTEQQAIISGGAG